MDRDVINLCGDEDSPSICAAIEGAGRHAKRRRAPVVTSGSIINLSDEEPDDEQLARSLWEEERTHATHDLMSDQVLAQRLQEEEDLTRLHNLARLHSLPREDPDSEFWPNVRAHADFFRQPFSQPFQPWRAHMHGAARRGGPAAGGRSGDSLAHLSFLDRDFGEADYEMLLQLDDVHGPEKKKARKANAKQLEQLPSRRLSRADCREEHACVICLETQREKQVVLTLPCKHEYHKSCVLKWLKSCEVPMCPTCKAPVLPDSQHSPAGGAHFSTADSGRDAGGGAVVDALPQPVVECWHT